MTPTLQSYDPCTPAAKVIIVEPVEQSFCDIREADTDDVNRLAKARLQMNNLMSSVNRLDLAPEFSSINWTPAGRDSNDTEFGPHASAI